MIDAALRDTSGQLAGPLTYDYRNSPRLWDIVTQSVCLTVSTVCIGMRLYTKLLVLRTAGWEDFTCFLAWVGLIAYAVITIEADKHGNGVHQELVAPEDLRAFAKLANASQITYAPLIFITKLSIFLLYLRVFAPSRQEKTYRAIQFLILFNLVFYLANFFLKIFQCRPLAKAWDRDIKGHCININIPILVAAAINVASDLMMLCLPITCVWRLQMTTKRKLGISAVFAAGIFGCISSIMRLVESVEHRSTKDKTFDWYPEFLWTTAEITSGILASSLPAIPTFIRHFFRKARTIFSSDPNHNNNSGSSSSHPRTWEKQNRVEMYTLSRGRCRKPRPLVSDLVTTEQEALCDAVGKDLDDAHAGNQGRIFPGKGGYGYPRCEARVEGRSTLPLPVERARDGEDDGRRHGILKIVEVDVELGPGGGVDRPLA